MLYIGTYEGDIRPVNLIAGAVSSSFVCNYKMYLIKFLLKGGRNSCAMSRVVHFSHCAEPVRQVNADLLHLAPTSLQHVQVRGKQLEQNSLLQRGQPC
jgi:hypothetical protein